MIIQIGNHQFDTELGYETLERISSWRWEEVPIIEDYPILQFAGKDTPTITFSGTWYNYVATGDRVQSLEDLANETEPLPLTGDDGHFYGFWVIKSLRRREAFFRPEQHSAIQNAWTLTIAFYGNTKQRGDAAQSSPFSISGSTTQSVKSVSKEVTAVAQQLKRTSNEIVKSTENANLAPLKTVSEYNTFVSNIKSDLPTLNQIESDLSDFSEADTPLSEIPTTSSLFDSVADYKQILDKGQEYRRLIGQIQSKANRIDTLRDNPVYQSFTATLGNYNGIITDAQQSKNGLVEQVLQIKDFIETASGVSITV